jgi:hypothetical protein
MLEIQKFLAANSLDDLRTRYSVKHKRHTKHPNLVLLKYDQIASPMGESLVRECRGIVLDESDGWRVVARAFDKFFNHGEGHAAPIDWATARVQDKVDGSLCMLYHHAGEWHVATTGTPDASGPVNLTGMTFAGLFWQTFRAMGLPLPDPDAVLVFELTSPYNRVVVRHAEPRLTLLAARSKAMGWQELPAQHFADTYPVVAEHPLSTLADVLGTFATIDPLQSEGYVVVDGAFNRIKAKHPGYVAIHRMKGNGTGPTDKRLLEVVRAGESSELLAHFPEWGDAHARISNAYEGLASELEAQYEEWKGIPIQKDFALKAKDSRCSGALFQVRSGKTPSVRAFLRDMRIEGLLSTLGLNDSQQQEEV